MELELYTIHILLTAAVFKCGVVFVLWDGKEVGDGVDLVGNGDDSEIEVGS